MTWRLVTWLSRNHARACVGMDASELEEMYAGLSLENESLPASEVDKNTLAMEQSRIKNCIVGKVLMSRSMNREAFRNSIGRLWGFERTIANESLGRNRFVFSFPNVQDKKQILNDGPWHFNKSLIVFAEPGMIELSKIEFWFANFWCRFIMCRCEV